jgi:hypothetical protein
MKTLKGFRYKVIDKVWDSDIAEDRLIIAVIYTYETYMAGNPEEPITECWNSRGYFLYDYNPYGEGEPTPKNIRKAISAYISIHNENDLGNIPSVI